MVTFLKALICVLKAVEVLAVTLMIAIGIDLGVYMYKESHPAKSRRFIKASAWVVAQSIRVLSWCTIEAKGRHSASKKRKEQLRVIAEKEASAHEGFFEESYVRGFDSNGSMLYRGCQVLTDEGRAFHKAMNDIDLAVDGKIFENTKEL
jgi:hypothetical protein